MPIKNYKPEQIVTMLRQLEVQMAKRESQHPKPARKPGSHTQT